MQTVYSHHVVDDVNRKRGSSCVAVRHQTQITVGRPPSNNQAVANLTALPLL